MIGNATKDSIQVKRSLSVEAISQEAAIGAVAADSRVRMLWDAISDPRLGEFVSSHSLMKNPWNGKGSSWNINNSNSNSSHLVIYNPFRNRW